MSCWPHLKMRILGTKLGYLLAGLGVLEPCFISVGNNPGNFRQVCLFPLEAATTYLNLGDFKEQKWLLSKLRSSKSETKEPAG